MPEKASGMGVVQVLSRRWKVGMRYGGIKLAKPTDYSAICLRLATAKAQPKTLRNKKTC